MKIQNFLLKHIGPLLIKFIYLTLNKKYHGIKNLHEHIIGLYHQHFFIFIGFMHFKIVKNIAHKYTTLVSPHKDGEILTQIIHGFGATTIRGDSRKKPIESLRKLISFTKQNYSPIFAMDGPLGPFKKIQPGILATARATGKPINLIFTFAEKKYIFWKAWDNFYIPRPFSKAFIYISDDYFPNTELTFKDALQKFKTYAHKEELKAKSLFRNFKKND